MLLTVFSWILELLHLSEWWETHNAQQRAAKASQEKRQDESLSDADVIARVHKKYDRD